MEEKIMTLEEIREEILKIQEKYYTPNSKIANACKVDKTTLCQLLNGKLTYGVGLDKVLRLQKWIKDRKVD